MSELRRRLLRLEAPRRTSLNYTISDVPGDASDQNACGAKLSPVMTEVDWQREYCERPQCARENRACATGRDAGGRSDNDSVVTMGLRLNLR